MLDKNLDEGKTNNYILIRNIYELIIKILNFKFLIILN